MCVIRSQKGLVKDHLHVGVFVPVESPGRGLFFGSAASCFELRFETFYDFADPVEIPFSVVEVIDDLALDVVEGLLFCFCASVYAIVFVNHIRWLLESIIRTSLRFRPVLSGTVRTILGCTAS